MQSRDEPWLGRRGAGLAAGGLVVAALLLGWLLGRAGRPTPERPMAAVGAALPAGPRALTLATYNVHNFFDTFDNPHTADEATAATSAAQLAALAGAIRQINADVLVLQEVESGGMLREFAARYLQDCGYAQVVDEPTDDPRGLGLAALSRRPVLRIVSHRLAPLRPTEAAGAQNRFARDLLRLDVDTGGGRTLAVYVVHLKSRLDAAGDPAGAAWRRAEGEAAARIIREEMGADGRFAVLGDFNEGIEAPAVRAVRGATEPGLADALAGVPAEERITFRSGRFAEGIDHILLSPGLATEAGAAEILDGGVFEKASDHRPVRVRVRAE